MMLAENTINNSHAHEEHHDSGDNAVFGFWVYILSDCILFAMIFATYVALNHIRMGDVPGMKMPVYKLSFSMPFVLVETFILLTSSFTYGLAMLASHKKIKGQVLFWLFVTFLLGLSFICMELHEFSSLIAEGNSFSKNASMSSFFTLVGTHGLHVASGLIWMLSLMFQVMKHGVMPKTQTKLACLSLFWHFLDIVWIFVFTIVYLMGAI